MFIGFSVSLPRMKNIATMVETRPKARTTSGKKIQAVGLRPAGLEREGVDADAEDHGADVLGGGGLEEVGAAAGAVADVVADEVRDDARVARVVLGNAGLDLADEVRAHVGGLGVDTAAELGEEGHEAGAEAVADDQERGVLVLSPPARPPLTREDATRRRGATGRRRGSRRPRRRAWPPGRPRRGCGERRRRRARSP